MSLSFFKKIKLHYETFLKNRIKIDSSAVGQLLKPVEIAVNFRQCSNYAAAIGDENPLYFDTARKGGSLAHPLFPVALSWGIIERLEELWELDLPEAALNRLVHQSEWMEVRRLIRPGEQLRVEGKLAAMLPHKLGVKLTLQLDYLDAAGELVVREFTGALLLGVKLRDEGQSLEGIPDTRRIEGKEAIWTEEVPVSRLAPYLYDGCTDIVSRIHTDREYARSVGLPDLILHGTATLGRAISVVLRREAGNDPRRVKALGGKFTGMVVPPDRLQVRLLTREQQLYFEVLNGKGEAVIKGGFVELRED